MSTVEQLLADKGYTLWTIAPEDTVYQAIKLMADKNIGAVPVVQDNRLVGILSERDYTRKIVLQDRSSKHTRVAEIMTTNVCYISPRIGVDECMRIMSKHHFRHLPVVLDNEVIGMVSVIDVVKVIINNQKDIINQLENNISWSEAY